MAMKKAKETPAGVTIDYWRIAEISIQWTTKTARIRIVGYFSADARMNNKEFIDQLYYNVSPLKFDGIFGTGNLDGAGSNPVKEAYKYIKGKDSFFADAQDI